jgi:5-methylcytosine-specific restriction endonuclease McrA
MTHPRDRALYERNRRKLLGSGRQLVCFMGHLCYVGLPRNHPLGATVDHVIPKSRGGSSELGNLRIACRFHNTSRGVGRTDPKPPLGGTSRKW